MDGVDGIHIAKAAAYLGAAFAIGVGSMGPALGQGSIGKVSCENIAKFPENAGQIRTTMLMAMGVVESSAIYSLVIAILLIFRF